MAAHTLVTDQSDDRSYEAGLALRARNGDVGAQEELFLRYH
jgi:hypothetical protein